MHHSKKNVGYSLRTIPERFERVQALKSQHSISMLCENLLVSTSGYYDWERRQSVPGPRALEDRNLAVQVEAIHAQSRRTYGGPRIQAALRADGRHHGRKRIARLMRQKGLQGRQKGRYRVLTTDSNHDHPIAPNRLAEAPAPCAPNQIWVADITYIHTREGWIFLAGILDLFSRKIVGWAMSDSRTPDIGRELSVRFQGAGTP